MVAITTSSIWANRRFTEITQKPIDFFCFLGEENRQKRGLLKNKNKNVFFKEQKQKESFFVVHKLLFFDKRSPSYFDQDIFFTSSSPFNTWNRKVSCFYFIASARIIAI